MLLVVRPTTHFGIGFPPGQFSKYDWGRPTKPAPVLLGTSTALCPTYNFGRTGADWIERVGSVMVPAKPLEGGITGARA